MNNYLKVQQMNRVMQDFETEFHKILIEYNKTVSTSVSEQCSALVKESCELEFLIEDKLKRWKEIML